MSLTLYGKNLDLPKLKAFTDNNLKVAQMVQLFFDRVKKLWEKKKTFLKPSLRGSLKAKTAW